MASSARICLISQRGLTQQLSRASNFEFEDVISTIDDVDLLTFSGNKLSPLLLRAKNKISLSTSRHGLVPSGVSLSQAIGNAAHYQQSDHIYDLTFILVQSLRDLLTLSALPNWRKHTRHAVCFVEEIWRDNIPALGQQLQLLSPFEQIYTTCSGSVEALSAALGKQVHFFPMAIDTLKFTPFTLEQSRNIQIYNMGRRSMITHQALLKDAEAKQYFYCYDSLRGPYNFQSHKEHRALLANLIKQSRYFVANYGKFDLASETKGQTEFGVRFIEGMAGGAVVIGDLPKTPAFEEQLGWQDSLIPVPFDSADIANRLEELDRDPERLAQIRARNVEQALARHDVLHRWQLILDRAGLATHPHLAQRLQDLENRKMLLKGPA